MNEILQPNGSMMLDQLTVAKIAQRAERVFGEREVVARTATFLERTDYRSLIGRVRRLASALHAMGVKPGDRIASFAWNNLRHLELYLAVPALGAVLHTVNIRLHEDEIRYILEHAGSQLAFMDSSVAGRFPRVCRTEILMLDGEGEGRSGSLDYECLIASGDPDFVFPEFAETTPAVLCYTSGTTGRPKGVLYSHRSLALYALMANQPDSFNVSEADSVMPVVPMFHANAWGWPYIATMVGARLVLPGPAPTPRILADLIASERVTVAGAVPTVWQGIASLAPDLDLTSLREVVAGGSAVPESLIQTYRDLGVPMTQGWGMTETSPLALISRPRPYIEHTTAEETHLRSLQGRPLPFVDVRVDPSSENELQVKGPTVLGSYFNDCNPSPTTADGWLRTGDVAVMTHNGYVRLTDRTKDLIKSGGEWISSIDLENAILGHPQVIEAAVVAMPDVKWDERPCMFVVVRDGTCITLSDVRDYLASLMPSWSLPDRLEVVSELPRTSVGKIDKKGLRATVSTVAPS